MYLSACVCLPSKAFEKMFCSWMYPSNLTNILRKSQKNLREVQKLCLV